MAGLDTSESDIDMGSWFTATAGFKVISGAGPTDIDVTDTLGATVRTVLASFPLVA